MTLFGLHIIISRRLSAAALASLLSIAPALAGEVTVSAATSLSSAFKAVGKAYETRYSGAKVLFNFGASGALLQQLVKGAPVDVFASADQETMDLAQKQRLIDATQRRNFVSNELVLIVPAASTAGIARLADLGKTHVARVAMGNPGSVPVGRYARHALQAAHIWPAIQGKTIMTHNARQALDYVARGEVDAAFVYATDAALMKGKVKVAFSVPMDVPISYPIAPLATAANGAQAKRFVAYVLAPEGQAILAQYGFRRP